MTRDTPLPRRNVFLGGAAVAAGLVGAASSARAHVETSPSDVNVDVQGLSLRGHHPVAYQIEGRPVPGQAQFTATHDGATYRFASAASRDRFRANPGR